jgi:hypothetical protein
VVLLVVPGASPWAIDTDIQLKAGIKKRLKLALVMIAVLCASSALGTMGSTTAKRVGH